MDQDQAERYIAAVADALEGAGIPVHACWAEDTERGVEIDPHGRDVIAWCPARAVRVACTGPAAVRFAPNRCSMLPTRLGTRSRST